MANFIVVIDPDAGRRRRFLDAATERISPVGSLPVKLVESGDFACVWAAPARSPVSVVSSGEGAAIVWGDAMPGPGPERLDAAGLFHEWDPRLREVPVAFDGFHAAVRYDAVEGLSAGCDILGYFPIYYGFREGVLMVGASPELFRQHPLFPAKVSEEGLVGLLMVHALTNGRSLLEGVNRLSWGHALRWRPGEAPREVRNYSMAVVGSMGSDSIDDWGRNHSIESDPIAQLDAAFESAVRRHVPSGERHGVLLSGGRDSRLLSGYVVERGDTLDALTFGRPTDYEVIGARRTARELRLTHRDMPLDEMQLPENAEIQSRWEHLAMGFSNLHMWGAVEPLGDVPRRVVCGHGLETRAGEPLPPDFDAMMDLRKHRGIPRATLRRLLRPEKFDGVQESVEQELRESYASSSDDPRHRGWRFYLDHDWRSHAGGVPWKLTFGAWPIVPICDREVMNVIATMPESSIADRAAHDEIMRRRFPRLARLPLDRNNHDMLPLSPSRIDRMKEGVMGALRKRMSNGGERRYYHRVYDINGPGWRAVRRMAEPHRDRLSDLFDMKVVNELVPAPEILIDVENNVRDTFGTKLLLGLMIWRASCS